MTFEECGDSPVMEITDRTIDYDYATAENIATSRVTLMLLWLMIVCAAGAVLLFALGVFDDLRDVWAHPEHKGIEVLPRHPLSLRIGDTRAFHHNPEHSKTDSGSRIQAIPMLEPREATAKSGNHSETRGTRVV